MIMCNICASHPATVYFKGLINGQIVKTRACETCARKNALVSPFSKSVVPLSSIVATLAIDSKLVGSITGVICSGCGLSYAEFKDTTQLGCSECYATFESVLAPLMQRLQGNQQHVGKSAPRTVRATPRVQDLARLKLELREALTNEAYENAATLRDQIKTMEQQLTGHHG